MRNLRIGMVLAALILSGTNLAKGQSLPSLDVNPPIVESIKVAIWENDIPYLQKVLSTTANINIPDRNAWTPLHHAVKWKRLRVARYLLARGANANSESIHRITPITLAASQGSLNIVKLLLRYKASVNIKDEDGNSPIHEAAANNSSATIVKILLEEGADANAKNNQGRTPLMKACYVAEIAKSLIKHGASVNIKDATGKTALYFAVYYGCTKTAQVLIESEADPNTKDLNEISPLDIAKKRDDKALIKLLSKL